jgi:ligand-binding sensor domain-containing protein
LKNSNTFLNTGARSYWATRSVTAVLIAVSLAKTVEAGYSDRATSRYVRQQWGAEQGFPGGSVHAISQTADGYLWIGAEKELLRFDGFSFRLFDQFDSSGIAPGSVQALTADSEGGLWIQHQNMSLLRYRDGVFQNVLRDLVPKEQGVTAMCKGKNGEILFLARSQGILTYEGGGLKTLSITAGLPNFLVISIAESADGKVWLGTRDAGLFSLTEGPALTSIPGLLIGRLILCCQLVINSYGSELIPVPWAGMGQH